MKEYNQLGIYRNEKGESMAIPGDHEVGERIEYGPVDDPIRAKCIDLMDLPSVMRRDQVDGFIKEQMNEPDSTLKQKLEDAEGDSSLNSRDEG